jgi:retron-type reverse transcriptase
MFWNLPNLMKIAKVRPLHKKGGKQEISNYKPVSILPVFSKVLEILIYKTIVTFSNKHSVISEAQNGFREKKSTDTATQTFTEDIQKALDNKLLVKGIFLDLTKAFDIINHKLLLAKLELYGLRGILHSWMSSYFTGRTQVVEIQQLDENTSCKEIKYGVTQGSILEPLLFLFFINDLPQAVQETKVVLFVDDTSILLIEKTLTSLKEKTAKVMNQVENWFSSNSLI